MPGVVAKTQARSRLGVEVQFGWDKVGTPFSKNGLLWVPVWSKFSN